MKMCKSSACKHVLVALFVSLLCCAAAGAQHANALPVKMQLNQDLSSATAQAGQDVQVRVSESIMKDGKVAVAVGAPVRAHLSSVKRAGHGDRGGQIKLTMDSVQTVGGSWIPLHKGKMHRGSRMVALIAGPCSVPFPLTMFMIGEDINIPHGQALSAYVRTKDLP